MEDGFRESIEEIAAVFNGAGDYATIAKAYNICGELGIIREGTMVEVADKKGVAQLVTWTVPDGTFQTVCSVYGDFEYHVESSAIRVLYDEMGWQVRETLLPARNSATGENDRRETRRGEKDLLRLTG